MSKHGIFSSPVRPAKPRPMRLARGLDCGAVFTSGANDARRCCGRPGSISCAIRPNRASHRAHAPHRNRQAVHSMQARNGMLLSLNCQSPHHLRPSRQRCRQTLNGSLTRYRSNPILA
jgi:hypothetical protein